MVERLKKQIQIIKSSLVDIKNQREAEVYDKSKGFSFPPFPNYTVSEPIAAVFKKVREEVLAEKNLYSSANKLDASNEAEQPASPILSEDALNVQHVEHSYVNDFEKHIQTFSIFEYPNEKLPNHFKFEDMSQADINLFKVLYGELEYATENMAALGYNISIINKMKSAVESLSFGRTNDALTVLRTAKKNAPNNRSISFMLSQIYYYKVAHGSSEMLPEARGEAKKASLYSEDVNKDQLNQYRYSYALHESNYDPAKSLNLIRDYYLLNPESLTEGRGLGVHDGVHLKAWVLLSTMNPSLLTSYEVESIISITLTAATGVNFYLNVVRPQILVRLSDKDDAVINPLYKIEEMLAKSYQNYAEIVDTIQQNFDDQGSLLPQSKYVWTLEHRYVSLLLKAAPIPKFDEIYLYTSLDAKRHSAEAYPNRAMAAMGLSNVNYWQVWSLAITAVDGKGGARTLPAKRLIPYAEIYRKFDRLLEILQEYEKEIIPDEKWELIEKYMPDYEYSVFPLVAAGPDAFQAPSNPYYLNFYRQWVTHKPKGPLPSELIQTYADNGHFIDPDEVVAAFEGVARVISDDIHGLKTRAKEALKQCLKDKKNAAGAGKAKDMLREGHFKDYWWLYAVVLPLAVLTFFIISGAGGASSGFVMLLLIVGGAGALGYFIYNFASKMEGEDEGDAEIESEGINKKEPE